MLKSVETTLNIDMKFLFRNRPVDEEFYKYFVETAIKMFESSQLLKRNPNMREIIFNILDMVVNIQFSFLKNKRNFNCKRKSPKKCPHQINKPGLRGGGFDRKCKPLFAEIL